MVRHLHRILPFYSIQPRIPPFCPLLHVMQTSFKRRHTFSKILTNTRYLTSKVSMDIQTFAFLDTETTGLPYQECNKTKLTELCITIVQSNHIRLGVFPRVQSKLSFCFNPRKMVNPLAEKLTGLSNTLLEFQPSFTQETVEIILRFLLLQQKPVCFVAHNGNYFDYPILRAEIHKTGLSLPDDILCIDTLRMFKQLHAKQVEPNVGENEKKPNLSEISSSSNIPVELCDGFDELICQSVDKFESCLQEVNEKTPPKNSQLSVTHIQYSSSNIDNLYFNPNKSFSTMSTLAVSPIPTAKKKLVYEKPSFKLGDIYQRLTNKMATNAHRAEDDCSMLLECAATLGQEFVDWANDNALKFSDIAMMQPGKKIGTYY